MDMIKGPFVQFIDESEKCTFSQAGYLHIFDESDVENIKKLEYLQIFNKLEKRTSHP